MSRRTRRPRRKKVNQSLVFVQVAVLLVTLLIVLFFRDKVGVTASNFIDAFGASEDIQVNDAPNKPSATSETSSPEPTDATSPEITAPDNP